LEAAPASFSKQSLKRYAVEVMKRSSYQAEGDYYMATVHKAALGLYVDAILKDLMISRK
jgi:hypothetical protein